MDYPPSRKPFVSHLTKLDAGAVRQVIFPKSPPMNSTRSFCSSLLTGLIAASVLLAPRAARAATVVWDVDPAVSFVRLTIPDQPVTVAGVGEVTARMRDANSTTQWTDAGGRRAALDGTVATDYADSISIAFLTGQHNLFALEQTSLRHNPADWNPLTLSYGGTNTAPAAFGARVRGTYSFLTFDAAFLALRNVQFDIDSGAVPIAGAGFTGNQTQFAFSSSTGDVDGLDLGFGLGQPVPDTLGGHLSPLIATNSAGGVIQNLGGQSRKLTYTISMPISIVVQGMALTGTADGQIVAYATLPPEHPTLRISQPANGTVMVAWPAAVTGFVLEQNSALETTNWIEITNAPVVVGGERQVTLPVSPGSAFYRLRSQ